MRIAFDTNVLAYAEGSDDVARQRRVEAVLAALAPHELVLPTQVSAELYRFLTVRMRKPRDVASSIVRSWMRLIPVPAETTAPVFEAAVELVTRHRLQIFDAIILTAASEVGCGMLLSEDMQDGFVWRGVTVANPFAPTPHPLLVDLMRG